MVEEYRSHHYYGHVQDVSDVNLGWYMALPILVVVGIVLFVTGLWPLALLVWLFWPSRKREEE